MRVAVFVVLSSMLAAAGSAAAQTAAPAMSLREAVQYALEHSPALKVALAEVQRREGAATVAGSFRMPQLDLLGDAGRTRFERGYPAQAAPWELRFDTAQYVAGAEMRLTVWDFQKTSLELDAARERAEAARFDVDRRRQEVVFDTARSYLQAVAFGDLIEAAQSRIRSLQALLDRTNQLVAAGRAVEVDALKIQTRLAQIESDLAVLRAGQKTSLSALAAVMGLDGDLPLLTDTPTTSDLPSHIPEAELLTQARAGRPEVQAQDHEVLASERAEKAIHRSGLPRIDFRATTFLYGSNSPVGFTQFIGTMLPQVGANLPAPDNAVGDWTLGVRVLWPLFDGGRRSGQLQAARAQLEMSRQARRLLELRIDREVRTAMADLESAQGRVRALRNSVVESERVLHDEKLKFDAGRSIVNTVLDAEAALLTSQSLLSQAQRSVSIAALALDLSLGRVDVDRLPK